MNPAATQVDTHSMPLCCPNPFRPALGVLAFAVLLASAAAQAPADLPSAPEPQIHSTRSPQQVALLPPGPLLDEGIPLSAGDAGAAASEGVDGQPETAPVLSMAPHSEDARYWVSGQANSIFQMHGHFRSPYEGPNSLQDIFEYKASEVATL
jgi:hypothetical protein